MDPWAQPQMAPCSWERGQAWPAGMKNRGGKTYSWLLGFGGEGSVDKTERLQGFKGLGLVGGNHAVREGAKVETDAQTAEKES